MDNTAKPRLQTLPLQGNEAEIGEFSLASVELPDGQKMNNVLFTEIQHGDNGAMLITLRLFYPSPIALQTPEAKENDWQEFADRMAMQIEAGSNNFAALRSSLSGPDADDHLQQRLMALTRAVVEPATY